MFSLSDVTNKVDSLTIFKLLGTLRNILIVDDFKVHVDCVGSISSQFY